MSTVFETAMAEATQAANTAGDLWMANARPQFRVVERANPFDDKSPVVKDWGTMLDVCGFARIEIGDKRTSFAKWLKKRQNGSNYSVRLNHNYSHRQELGLAEACACEALKVFQKYGIDKGLSLWSRID